MKSHYKVKNYKLEGIVIKRINYQEADRIIIIFSKESGKIKVIGKSIRKITSRRAPHLEIFSHVKVFVHESKHLPYITEAELICGFSCLRKNFRKVAIAYHLCEIVEKLIPEKEKNEELFNLLIATLHKIEDEKSTSEVRRIVRVFVYSLLNKLGYLNPKKTFSYSQLIYEIENISERPLSSLKLLTKIARNLQ